MHMGTFDLEHVKVIRCPVSEKKDVTRKRLITERNGRKFGPLGGLCCMDMDTFALEHVNVILGSFLALAQNWFIS